MTNSVSFEFNLEVLERGINKEDKEVGVTNESNGAWSFGGKDFNISFLSHFKFGKPPA